jgi:hypothetical protein
LDFTQVEGGWGVFKSSFAAQETGKYTIEISSDPYNRHLKTELLVARPVVEKEGQPINSQTLTELATLTHGDAVSTDGLDKLVRQISLLPEPKEIVQRVRIWSEPAWGGVILSLLTIYWAGRKWSGLI